MSEKLDPMLGEASSPASRTPGARSLGRLGPYWDSLAVLLLVLASLPAAWVSPRSVTVVRSPGFIDDNWALDSVFKASRGIWIGRDVAFTHGPLFQWLSSVPGRSMGVSMGGTYATWNTVPVWCALLFVFLTLRLVLPEQSPWKRCLLLLLLCIFWGPTLRTAFAVLAFAVFLRGWYIVGGGRAQAVAFGCVAALVCVVGFLVAADLGVYTMAALGLTFAAVAIDRRRASQGIGFLAAWLSIAACSAVVAVATNSVLAKPLDFRFWRDSLVQVSAYRWATPFRMSTEGAMYLFWTLLAGAAIFLLRAATRPSGNPAIVQRTGFLIGGFAFALVLMQSGLVRADNGHIALACFPMIFLAGAIMFSFESPNLSVAAMLAGCLCSVGFGQAAFLPSTLTRLYAASKLTICPAGFTEFERACYAPEFTDLLQSVARYLQQNSGTSDSIVVFPYQTMFGIASRRNVAGGLMQPYTASGTDLAQLEIAGLERAPAPAGLYLPDPDLSHLSDREVAYRRSLNLSLPVDGVANFTRTPEVWFWLVHHYRSERQLGPAVFGLRRDDSRASRISMQAQSLGLAARTYPVTESSSATNLGAPNWPSNADFLRLRLVVRYGPLWKLRKPERMQVEITRADGSRDMQWFVLPPNTPAEVWLYPWSASDLIRYFDAEDSHWRPNPRPAITLLRLIATPLDWVSQTPDAITLESADAVRLAMPPR
ncbi:MAG TPA: hypothetical protein VMT15_21950 [Bryobacteraceae bacterium]|nr:hypothetical protein [Bryobacteraceae bacterium]